jgi:hypothetical protein
MTEFALEIDALSSRNGWMNCWLVVDGQRHRLEATSVFPPFSDLLAFAKALVTQALPHEFIWDEESHGAIFQALPVAPESPNFILKINHDGEIVVEAEFDRLKIVRGLLEALRGVALDCPGAESEWEFPYFLIENFERELAQGFALAVNPQELHAANFIFGHYGGYGGQVYPAFTLWVNDEQLLSMWMGDIPRFWWLWFEFLEKIGTGALPAEAVFHQEGEDLYDDHADLFLTLGLDTTRHFQAQALSETDNFQLRIVIQMNPPGDEQIHLDAPFERRQFVDSFARAFKEFLETSYPAFLESDEHKFDLRTLPLNRLTT